MPSATAALFSDANIGFLQQTLDNSNPLRQASEQRHGVNFQLLDEGVLLVESSATQGTSQPSLLLSAGIHGNETAPIELLDRLVNRLLGGELKLCCRLLLILGNPPAMRQGQRFIDTNLNRLFSLQPAPGNSIEHRRAQTLMGHVDAFFDGAQGPRLHYDLHTAIRGSQYEKFAVYPHNTRTPPWDRDQLGFLAGSGIEAVLFQDRPSPTFSWYSSNKHGANGFTLELGKVRPFGDNAPERLLAMEQNLIALIQDQQPSLAALESLQLFRIRDEVIRQGEHFELLFDDDLPNFSRFEPGCQISRDEDNAYYIQDSPGYIIFPNAKVEIGARAALIAQTTEASELFPASETS
ncbi:succinylglutamate desuccinylase [Aestuariirhabdus sp. Z084]|uniref:succinylglutamate desuccinylase n=1 Tax=Aestuariirhabdus haliotis TaxID=2918751 RepID=UPI00201B3553|nr:succinylglutamate desuccinylase [Aestuariirhabdus haliotis]MCL6416793.1 succinylglutamate desuccinylase [Aestuariirhabdus haliotis]MCL6420793.1 succinylglutamate desuccinylase [Aestuariirhabdus haliotis]